MLFLLFEIGDQGFALPAHGIVEVLPLIAPTRLQGAPPELAGMLRYRGAFVPVVDLSQLALGRPATARLGTRIVIVALDGGEASRQLGLVAERATEMFSADPAAFAPFARGPRGLVQRFRLDRLLPPALLDRLFAELSSTA